MKLAVVLISAYMACQMIADIAAVKMVSLFGLVIPAGTFIYAVTFTVRDLIHKRLGKTVARWVVASAAVINIGMALYFVFTINLGYPVFWQGQEAYATILGVVPSIVAASIIAEFVSEMVDTELYQIAWEKFARNRQWLRVVFSNLFSVPLDSLVFAVLAFRVFTPSVPWSGIAAMVLGQSLFKWAVATVVMPLTYLVKPSELAMYDKYVKMEPLQGG